MDFVVTKTFMQMVKLSYVLFGLFQRKALYKYLLLCNVCFSECFPFFKSEEPSQIQYNSTSISSNSTDTTIETIHEISKTY